MNTDFNTALDGFIEKANVKINYNYDTRFPNITRELLESKPVAASAKYVRVIKGGAIYCFISLETGDIFKPAGYKAPAKGVRGNIFAEDNGVNCAGVYGISYMTNKGELYHPAGI